MAKLIEEAMNEKVAVTENGRRRVITKGEAIAKQLVNKAAGGDLQAARLLVSQQKATEAISALAERDTAIEAPAPSSSTPPTDLANLTTAELQILYEAALILEGQGRERPPPLLPPGDVEDPSKEED